LPKLVQSLLVENTNAASATPFPATRHNIRHRTLKHLFQYLRPTWLHQSPNIRSPCPEPEAIRVSDELLPPKPQCIFANSDLWAPEIMRSKRLKLRDKMEEFILSQYPTALHWGIKCIKSGLGTDQLTSFSYYAAAPRMPRQLCCGVRCRLFDYVIQR
jgi:hypothetical protein